MNDAIVASLVSLPAIRTVILSGRWALWAEGSRYKREAGKPVSLAAPPRVLMDNHVAVAAGLERVVSDLVAGGKQVWLVGPIPEIGYNVPHALYLDALHISSGFDIRPTLEEFNNRQSFVLALFAAIVKKYPVQVVWPHQGLCDARLCQVQWEGRPLYTDDQHLTQGAARSISAIFDQIFAAPPSQDTVVQ